MFIKINDVFLNVDNIAKIKDSYSLAGGDPSIHLYMNGSDYPIIVVNNGFSNAQALADYISLQFGKK